MNGLRFDHIGLVVESMAEGRVALEGMFGVDRWTQVFKTRKGRPVRADFHVVQSEPPWLLAFEQDIPGTPFERVLNELVVEIRLEPVAGGGTEVSWATGIWDAPWSPPRGRMATVPFWGVAKTGPGLMLHW